MPPKRKAAAATKAGGKKIKEEPDAPEDAFKSAREALKSAPKKKCKSKVDENCHLSWDSTSENELNDSEDEDGLISCPQIKTATLSLLMKIQKLEAELKYERRCRIIAEKELRQCKEMNNLMAQMRGTANELRSILNYAKMGIEDAQNRNGSSAVGINQVSVASPENDSQDDKFIELPGGLKVQKNLYNRISTTDFKKYTSELLMLVFNRETLATHSLQGRKSYNSKEDFQKPPLPSEELANIIEHVKIKFGVDSSLIRAAIRTKLNNEDKMLKKRLNNLIST